MKQKFEDNAYFHFHNANPKGKKACDCVIRAISVALGQTWEKTYREMAELGIKMGFILNEKHVEEAYLKSKGWEKMKEPRKSDNTKMDIRRFIDRESPREDLIVYAGSHHVSLIRGKKVWDTWDCSHETMHTYYVKVR